MIEVMTRPGGCLGGGGQPKSDDPRILEKRAEAIYKIYKNMPVRKSHENKEETSEKYLHASYAARDAPRNMLLHFLDALDHRDAMVASNLFIEDGVWETNTATKSGILRTRKEISEFIKTKLPPLEEIGCCELHPRHKMVDHAEGTDALSPIKGMKFHFDVEQDEKSGLIKMLKRTTIETAPLKCACDDPSYAYGGMEDACCYYPCGELNVKCSTGH